MRRILLAASLLVFGWTARADFQVPELTGPVVDQAHMLRPEVRESLSHFLHELKSKTGTQLEVATVPDLGGLSLEEASIKITDKWQLGTRKDDRGVLFLIAAKEHRLRIEVGQGLEGDLPDVIASRIIRDEVSPRMREGHPNQAVLAGVAAIVRHTDPDFLKNYSGMSYGGHAGRGGAPWGTLISLGFFLLVLMLQVRIFGWGALWWLSGFGGGFGSGGGFGGGSWGGGDGGWSGGGGGFSGGGASGGW